MLRNRRPFRITRVPAVDPIPSEGGQYSEEEKLADEATENFEDKISLAFALDSPRFYRNSLFERKTFQNLLDNTQHGCVFNPVFLAEKWRKL